MTGCTSLLRRHAAAAAMLGVLGTFCPRDAHANAPSLIPVQGFLTDDAGEPLDGMHDVELLLFTQPVDGEPLFSEVHSIEVDAGLFSISMGAISTLDASIFVTHDELWVETRVDGETLRPRLQLGSVPYALHAATAGSAATIGGASPDAFQRRIDDTCVGNRTVRAINADGTVECRLDDDTTYSAGVGLQLSETTFNADTEVLQARVASFCPAGSAIRAILSDGSVECQTVPESFGPEVVDVPAGAGSGSSALRNDVIWPFGSSFFAPASAQLTFASDAQCVVTVAAQVRSPSFAERLETGATVIVRPAYVMPGFEAPLWIGSGHHTYATIEPLAAASASAVTVGVLEVNAGDTVVLGCEGAVLETVNLQPGDLDRFRVRCHGTWICL